MGFSYFIYNIHLYNRFLFVDANTVEDYGTTLKDRYSSTGKSLVGTRSFHYFKPSNNKLEAYRLSSKSEPDTVFTFGSEM